MNFVERAVIFECNDNSLVGVASLPELPAAVGVVVVVGGPQYRVGSHRQFVRLTRALAEAGIPCLRFDYRGMGDSEGDARTFEEVGADIAAAVTHLKLMAPSVDKVVLWGLCDGASAALMALASLTRIAGVIILNPWVRSDTSLDRVLVKHYYAERLFSREFWSKLVSGRVGVWRAASEFAGRVRAAVAADGKDTATRSGSNPPVRYQDRMCDGLDVLQGAPLLVVLSGKDLTAQEYVAFAGADPRWKGALARNPRVTTEHLPEADHTFSDPGLRAEVERLSCRFVLAIREEVLSNP
jgi:exosortase A-associated hydrolase 1